MNKQFAKPALSVIAAAVIAALLTSPSFAFDRQEEALAVDELALDHQLVSGWREYSGTAQPGSSIHNLVQSTVPVPVTYPVKFSMRVEGAATELFDSVGVQAFAESLMFTKTKHGKNTTTIETSPWDPGPLMDAPERIGQPGDHRSGCSAGFFGFPPQPATINYTWEWRQYDSNENGRIDESDEYAWQLSSYSVTFPQDVSVLPVCP
jgi:hypothetical protein